MPARNGNTGPTMATFTRGIVTSDEDPNLFQLAQLVANLGRFLEIEMLGRVLHLLRQPRDRFVEILPFRQVETRFRRRPAGHFEIIEVRHLYEIAVDRLDDRGRLDAVFLVVLLLDRAPPLRLRDRELDRVGHLVRVQNRHAFEIARAAADGLDQRRLRTEKTFLVRIEDSHARAFGDVEPFPQQVDADQHVVRADAEVADDGDALQRLDVGVQVVDLDAELHQVARQILGHPLRQRRHHHALTFCDALLDDADQIVDLTLDRLDDDVRIEQSGRTDDLLREKSAGLFHLERTGRRGDVDDLRQLSFELLKRERTIVDRAWQTESVFDQRLLARAVAAPHRPDLRNGLVRLIDDEEK